MDDKKPLHKSDPVADLQARKHVITQDRSQFLIGNFKKNRDRIISPELRTKDKEVGILPYSECFNAEAVRRLLEQPGCVGMRVHSGLNEDFQMVFVLRGVDARGNDILPGTKKNGQMPEASTMLTLSFSAAAADESSLDDGQRVPPWPQTAQ